MKVAVRCGTVRGILFFLAFMACGGAFAVDYYIAPSGNDANSGLSSAQAWQSLAPVNAKEFSPGDRVLFEGGSCYTGQLALRGSGTEARPIIVDKYGEGPLPRFDGEGKVEATVLLYNVQYWRVRNIEITNKSDEAIETRNNGLFIHIKDFGAARGIELSGLYIHDISGNGKHHSDSGDGISWHNEGENKPSWFDGILIERCRFEKTALNGIWGWSSYWFRHPWHPSLNVVIRHNVLEDIGMSGIVVSGCEGALIEHNYIARPSRGGDGGIGVWPFSSDNTIVQFNEVTGCDGTHDGKAFDSDYNCRNTVFQYNYSHDNAGGFVMFCTPGINEYNIGCEGTVVRYNISVNDGGTVDHVFSLGGPCKNTYIYNNTVYCPGDRYLDIIELGDWEGYPTNTFFYNNLVYTEGSLGFEFTQSKNNVFGGNAWFGIIKDPPEETLAVTGDPKILKPGAGGDIRDTHRLSTLDGYRLQPGSPLIDKALDLRKVLGIEVGLRDYYGAKIPAGEGFDIGAHEFVPQVEPPK